jgi:prepilin-type N-terminal cleavage/methylation domain-containing protein/prepilin-type processing-associated H-X9-DG protein
MKPRHKSRRRPAFTLVELLAVVAIISLLIALLLPALGRARDHANRVKCAGNLRSLGQALVMYTQQYGRYPAMGTSDGSVNIAVWPARLRPFLGGNRDVFYCPSQDERCRWTSDAPEPVVRCPGGLPETYGYEPGEPLIHGTAYFSYGYNGYGIPPHTAYDRALGFIVIADPNVMPSVPRVPEVAVSRVKVPEDMVAIADSTVDGRSDWFIKPTEEITWPGRVHGGGANVVFCDGQVAWYPQKDLLVTSNSNDPVSEAMRRMWNADHLPR